MKEIKEELHIPQKSNNPDKKQEDFGSITLRFTKKTFRYLAIAVAAVILVYWGLNNTDKVSSVFGKILTVLEPFILGFCIAFIINVPMHFLEEKFFGKGKKEKIFTEEDVTEYIF